MSHVTLAQGGGLHALTRGGTGPSAGSHRAHGGSHRPGHAAGVGCQPGTGRPSRDPGRMERLLRSRLGESAAYCHGLAQPDCGCDGTPIAQQRRAQLETHAGAARAGVRSAVECGAAGEWGCRSTLPTQHGSETGLLRCPGSVQPNVNLELQGTVNRVRPTRRGRPARASSPMGPAVACS